LFVHELTEVADEGVDGLCAVVESDAAVVAFRTIVEEEGWVVERLLLLLLLLLLLWIVEELELLRLHYT
jgi:hypothetical protein